MARIANVLLISGCLCVEATVNSSSKNEPVHVLLQWPDGTVPSSVARATSIERTIADVLVSQNCAALAWNAPWPQAWATTKALEVHILGAIPEFEQRSSYSGFSESVLAPLRRLGMPLAHIRVVLAGVEAQCNRIQKEKTKKPHDVTVTCIAVNGPGLVKNYTDSVSAGEYNPDVAFFASPGFDAESALWFQTIHALVMRRSLIILAESTNVPARRGKGGLWYLKTRSASHNAQGEVASSGCKRSGLYADQRGSFPELMALGHLHPEIEILSDSVGMYPAWFVKLDDSHLSGKMDEYLYELQCLRRRAGKTKKAEVEVQNGHVRVVRLSSSGADIAPRSATPVDFQLSIVHSRMTMTFEKCEGRSLIDSCAKHWARALNCLKSFERPLLEHVGKMLVKLAYGDYGCHEVPVACRRIYVQIDHDPGKQCSDYSPQRPPPREEL